MSKQTSSPSQTHRLQQTIYENLPVGMELYDCEGRLIEINSVGLKMMGVKDKQDMLGINIFENPNVPDEMKSRLRAGENIRFTVKYDFELAKFYYPTTLSGIRYFEITVSVVRDDENKEIDKFLFIAQDVTETVRTEEILRQSKQKPHWPCRPPMWFYGNLMFAPICSMRRMNHLITAILPSPSLLKIIKTYSSGGLERSGTHFA